MADIRIRIAKDKAKLVKALKEGKDFNSPFQTYADVVAFAAVLGAVRGKRKPLGEIAQSDPDPIPQEHFISRKYETIIDLLAVTATLNPKILSDTEVLQEEKIRLFEEYANSGFEIIQLNLDGCVDYLDQILLLLSAEKLDSNASEDFDSGRFFPI